MPKIKQNYDTYRNQGFSKAIRIRLVQLDMREKDLAEALNISASRTNVLMKNPEALTIDRFRSLITFLGLSPEQVLRFLGYPEKVIKKLSEEKKDESI